MQDKVISLCMSSQLQEEQRVLRLLPGSPFLPSINFISKWCKHNAKWGWLRLFCLSVGDAVPIVGVQVEGTTSR